MRAEKSRTDQLDLYASGWTSNASLQLTAWGSKTRCNVLSIWSVETNRVTW